MALLAVERVDAVNAIGNAKIKDIVAGIKDIVRSKIDAAAYDAWIAPLKVSQNKNRITLVAGSRFNADFIRATFGGALNDVENEIGMEIVVENARPNLRLIENPANQNVRRAQNDDAAAPPPADFDDFVCSESNKFALSAIRKCASGHVSFSPLVIYGASGTGKSMLADLLKRNAKARVVSISGTQFVSDFVRAMKTDSIFAWKDAMRGCDMLIMDDVQAIAGKRASADEFLSLLDELIRMGKNVVLTSNIAPSQIAGFDRRLISLMSSGLSVDLSAPDASVRQIILEKSSLRESGAKWVAARAPANGHIVSGICKKISAWRELDCGELSESVLEKLLRDVLEKEKTPIACVKNMCAKLGVSFDDVMSARRTRAIVFARQKIMAALKMSTGLTLAEIGRLVGGRDHASVLYALSQIEKIKRSDMLLTAELAELAK
jgi:chromosomal replication initiator protein